MQKYHEIHAQDGVVLWFCFLHHFASTSTENIIEAYSLLSESKVRLSLYNGNVLNFTNATQAHLHHLIKANETPRACITSYMFFTDVLKLQTNNFMLLSTIK
jgi:hypothetical protein